MFCKECGSKLSENAKFCSKCGASCGEVKKEKTTKAEKVEKKEVKALTKDEIIAGDTKVFKIVSYLGILWILGIFCGSKNDPKVRFHVGQGIILTIALVAVSIVSAILTAVIASLFTVQTWLGINVGVSGVGLFLIGLINLVWYGAYIFYVVLGIINAAKDRENKLPLIGNLAFYK